MSELIDKALQIFDAYMHEFHPEQTDTFLYQLASTIIRKIGDPALLEDEVNRFAEQVVSEFQRLGVSPQPPSLDDRELAMQIASEVDEYREARLLQVSPTNVLQPIATGDLEISANLQFTSRPSSSTEPSESS